MTTKTTEDHLFFYMPNEKYGEFCNWFPSPFSLLKGEIYDTVFHNRPQDRKYHDAAIVLTFGCVEQAFMYCKALKFNDREIQARIMSTSNPKEQKKLGRSIYNFVVAEWDQIKASIMLYVVTAKFSQNEKLKRKLRSTKDKILVEAASRDRVWGIVHLNFVLNLVLIFIL
ncbi:MAG: NADAR family protein [Sphingobacteriaceae bacterium]|nr:MAG: NADAR family protein [Sphingobacteriaceae bacterium]